MDCIIVDTSSIVFSLSNKKDVFESIKTRFPEAEPIVSIGIVKELQKLASKKGKYSKYANVGVMLIKNYEFDVVKCSSNVDAWIIRESTKRGCAVCTNDIKLKKKLVQEGVAVFSVSRDGSLR